MYLKFVRSTNSAHCFITNVQYWLYWLDAAGIYTEPQCAVYIMAVLARCIFYYYYYYYYY